MTHLTKLACWFCGHDWEALRTFGIDVSPLGHGLMRYKKCRRCGKEETVFEAFANIFSGTRTKSPAPLKPSTSRGLLALEEKESKDALNKSTSVEEKETEASSECNEVSKCDECNKS